MALSTSLWSALLVLPCFLALLLSRQNVQAFLFPPSASSCSCPQPQCAAQAHCLVRRSAADGSSGESMTLTNSTWAAPSNSNEQTDLGSPSSKEEEQIDEEKIAAGTDYDEEGKADHSAANGGRSTATSTGATETAGSTAESTDSKLSTQTQTSETTVGTTEAMAAESRGEGNAREETSSKPASQADQEGSPLGKGTVGKTTKSREGKGKKKGRPSAGKGDSGPPPASKSSQSGGGGVNRRNCNSELMHSLIMQNMHRKPSVAKRQIQAKVSAQIGGRIDVVCARDAFSYIVNSELFCEAEKDGLTCLCFKQQS